VVDPLTSALEFIGVMLLAIGFGVLVGTATNSAGWGLVVTGGLILLSSFLATLSGRLPAKRSSE
jgi:F0F1-type ATP synthase assembly protein I